METSIKYRVKGLTREQKPFDYSYTATSYGAPPSDRELEEQIQQVAGLNLGSPRPSRQNPERNQPYDDGAGRRSGPGNSDNGGPRYKYRRHYKYPYREPKTPDARVADPPYPRTYTGSPSNLRSRTDRRPPFGATPSTPQRIVEWTVTELPPEETSSRVSNQPRVIEYRTLSAAPDPNYLPPSISATGPGPAPSYSARRRPSHRTITELAPEETSSRVSNQPRVIEYRTLPAAPDPNYLPPSISATGPGPAPSQSARHRPSHRSQRPEKKLDPIEEWMEKNERALLEDDRAAGAAPRRPYANTAPISEWRGDGRTVVPDDSISSVRRLPPRAPSRRSVVEPESRGRRSSRHERSPRSRPSLKPGRPSRYGEDRAPPTRTDPYTPTRASRRRERDRDYARDGASR